MATDSGGNLWALEVVRGAESGRRYPLGGGTTTLGNALGGEPGIDLSSHEGPSPRKMAGRQAQIHVANGSLTLRDLGSAGGTFVDRRRVPAHSDLPLQPGAVIQLGGVQLRVERGATEARPAPPASTPPPVPPAAFLFALKSGASCRTWDDFLAVSAQKWGDLRDELTSGRLASFLHTIGRGDLAPDPRAPGSPDERLDAWIGRIPTTKAARPELEVHPRTVIVRAATGGGVVRKTVQVGNAGYRLLRSTARVEPAGSWLRLAPEYAGREIITLDATDLAFDVAVPEGLAAATAAEVVIEGNGGTARVSVRIEPAAAKADLPSPAPSRRPIWGDWRERIARRPARSRLMIAASAAAGVRMILGLANSAAGAGLASLELLGPALALAALGAGLGAWAAARGGEARDVPSGGLAGAVLGAMLAAVLVALARTVEGPLAAWSSMPILVPPLLWGLIGAGLAAASIVGIPPRLRTEPTA